MKKEDEKSVKELLEKIKRLEAPDAPEGWFPFDNRSKDFVLASKEREGHLEIKSFRREGVWNKIWEYFDQRDKLLDEMEKILRKYPEFNVIAY